MNKEKLSKIFEIYRELNRLEEFKITINVTNTDQKLIIAKKITVIILPDKFIINGDLSSLSKENLNKILDELKNNVDKEYENLKTKINNLREKF